MGWVETRESQIGRTLTGVVPIHLIRNRVGPAVEASVWVYVCDQVGGPLANSHATVSPLLDLLVRKIRKLVIAD